MKSSGYALCGAGGEAKYLEIIFIPKSKRISEFFKKIKTLNISYEGNNDNYCVGGIDDTKYIYYEKKNFFDYEVDAILKFGLIFDDFEDENGSFSLNMRKCEMSEHELFNTLTIKDDDNLGTLIPGDEKEFWDLFFDWI